MKDRSQSGFTLIELMFASTATMLVLAPAFALLLHAGKWYDEIQSELAVNRHARLTFDILINGARSQSTGNDGTKALYGLSAWQQAPNGSLRSNYAFRFSSNGLTVSPDKFAAISVTCTGTAAPLPDCGTGTRSVTGWIGADADIEDRKRVIAGRTMEIIMTFTDPQGAQRAKNSAIATETFRTIATFMRDENDP